MHLNHLAYQFAKADLGLKEVPGGNHNPRILLYHACTTFKAMSDEVPWCSSAMNGWFILANLKLNPFETLKELRKRHIHKSVVDRLCEIAGIDPLGTVDVRSIKPLVAPTFSAAAISWADWGVSTMDNPREGDVIIFKMKIGHHVALVKRPNLLTYSVLGANQADEVNYRNFMKYRVVDIRRAA